MFPGAVTTRGSVAPVVLLFLLLGAAGAVRGEDPSAWVEVDRYRFDLGGLPPGGNASGVFTLTNRGDAVTVGFVHEAAEGAYLHVDAGEVPLGAGESRAVPFAYRVPFDAPPGNHGESLRLVVQAPGDAQGEGNLLSAGTALIFTSRTLALGVSAVEAPDLLLPSEPLRGRVLLVNTANATVLSGVRLDVVGADGRTVGPPLALPPGEVLPESGLALGFDFPAGALPGGAHTLRATLSGVEPAGTPVGRGVFEKPLFVGTRQAEIRLTALEADGKGGVAFTLEINNTGSLEVRLRPRVVFTAEDGTVREILLDPVLVAPGAVVRVPGGAALPPGVHRATVDAQSLEGVDVDVAPRSTDVVVPAPLPRPPAPWGALAVAALLGAASVAAGGVAALRRGHSRESAPERPAWTVLLDFTSLHAGERRVPVARLAALFGAGENARVVGHFVTASRARASRAHTDMVAAGVEPRVRVAAGRGPGERQSYVGLTADAMEAAAAGRRVLLATHDPQYAELLLRLRGAGVHAEVAGFEGEVPVELLEAAAGARLRRRPGGQGAGGAPDGQGPSG